jgi:glyoxylase-like metal-dependent hydrolase (beta-lactamase superfamily II)
VTYPAVTYTGDVSVGGPADVRELPGLRVTKLAVGPYDNNVYLLRCAATATTVLVDGAAESDRILAALGPDPLVTVVQTHGHFDHVQALAEVRAATGAQLLCHAGDASMMPEGQLPDPLADGDVVQVGEASLRAIHLAGHTPGGIALLYEGDPERPHLFTGDSLFPGGPGNTQQDPERFTSLMDDLETKVFGPLPDETWVYPGHGKDTTLGAERPSLPEWRERGW